MSHKVGDKVLLNTTTRRLEAEVLEVRGRKLLVYVAETRQTIEVPLDAIIQR